MDKVREFIRKVNACVTDEDIWALVNSIVEELSKGQDDKERTIGLVDGRKNCYEGGCYETFFTPKCKIKYDPMCPSYHFYDNDYLFSFIKYLKKLNIKETDSPMIIAGYVGSFLEWYFRRPAYDDKQDRRVEVMDAFSRDHADEFYEKYKLPRMEDATCEQQMDLAGEFPISIFKFNGAAKCTEWSTMAHNLLLMCGYKSFCLWGDAFSNGQEEYHAWNVVKANEELYFLIDYSNGSIRSLNGITQRIDPYVVPLTKEEFELFKSGKLVIEKPEVTYDGSKRVEDDGNRRRYVTGKSFERIEKEQDEEPQR